MKPILRGLREADFFFLLEAKKQAEEEANTMEAV